MTDSLYLMKCIWDCVAVVWSLSRVDSSVSPWTVACQALLSRGTPRQDYWNGLSFPPSRDLPNPGNELASFVLAQRFFTTEPPGMMPTYDIIKKYVCVYIYTYIYIHTYNTYIYMYIYIHIHVHIHIYMYIYMYIYIYTYTCIYIHIHIIFNIIYLS